MRTCATDGRVVTLREPAAPSTFSGEPRYSPGMSRARLFILFSILVFLVPMARAGKAAFYRKQGKTEAAGFTVIAPADKCSNWGWAAATETLLALDAVKVDQHVLVQKAFGGELCADDNFKLQTLGDTVAGDYVLTPKKKMRVVPHVYGAGTNIPAEDLIAAIKRGRPMIFFWKMHAYVAVGAAYDEYVGPNGSRLWEVRELTLLDPTAEDEEHRHVTFQKGRDDINEINGAIDLTLFPMEEIDWMPPQ